MPMSGWLSRSIISSKRRLGRLSNQPLVAERLVRNNTVMANEQCSVRRSLTAQSLAVRVTAITVITAILAAILITFTYARVCNQEVTSTGKIVETCRHLQITDPPMVAAGLVVFALLGVFYTEISGFGLSLRREVARATDKAEQATTVAEDARQKAQSAQSTAQVAENLSLAPPPSRTGVAYEKHELEQVIDTLANEYNITRHEMPSGDIRTSKMTAIVSRMISKLKGVDHRLFDVSAHLDSKDEGQRLAGYAYLYANPDPSHTRKIAATIGEDKPFAQYWALRTLRRQLQADPEALDLNTRRDLERLLGTFSGTDRAYELRHLLAEASG